MLYVDGRHALGKENELLAALLITTNNFIQTLGPDEATARFIAEDWRSSFDKLQGLNSEAIASSDTIFEKDFNEELDLLRDLLAACKGEKYADSWRGLFNKDIEIVEKLLIK
jgi:hypothetical protein